MYIPKYFKIADFEEIREFVQHNAFGTLVTTKKGRPIATHLPLQLIKEEEDYYITGHMAYGNPQWRSFETSEEALVMFQGPHAYISSSWYEHKNVPTWNYQSVHIYGPAHTLNEEELKQDLAKLLQKYESHRENPVLWDNLSPSLLEKELKGIVGFKIHVKEVQGAYKMSQNRNETDYRNIVEQLQNEKNPNAKQMAEVMKKKL
ncbi:FMN-binding negative transcriptional regulator [Planomicrobium sp. CPCC 101110]|uniref:FMN-binding negative transcriptional regulator n=1 Tax=Planomicrobium sp. CPCC 101110 TaxID=2599619 RepID=UPI0011B59ECA|nr:FMN-binding negative transcriptional regulator [Planomicrobium sp. CPCC 101110]TWT26056.1 FMN-binding negative transcriptional regulator [Planomicrobium sp. CPCC 101110]